MKRALLVLFLSAPVLGGLVVPSTRAHASPNQQEKSRVLRQVKASSAVQIFADNSQGSSLYIQEANVKEISGDDFLTLVGEPPRHPKLTTFPEVTLVNTSRTIKSFAILIQSSIERPKGGYVLLKRNLSIAPNSTYTVTSSEWPQAERVSIQRGDKFVSSLRQPGLDSSRSWIPGAASDMRVTIGLIEFDDGSRWKMPPGTDW